MSRLALLPIFALATLTACSPPGAKTSPETPSKSAVTGGSETAVATPPNPNLASVVSKDGSFTMLIPKDWVIASRSDPRFVSALKKVGNESMLKSVESMTSQPYFMLMAMDVKGIEARKEFVNNINVVVFPADPAMAKDMQGVAEASGKQVFGSGPYKASVIDSPNGKVGKYSGETSIGSRLKHDLIGGVFMYNGQAFTVTVSAAKGEGAELDKSFDEIVRSIKFK